MEILKIFGDWQPQAYGIWSLVFMGFAYAMYEYRQTRKLSTEDRLALREGYMKELENVRGFGRQLLNDLKELREEYNEYRKMCHAETDQLRSMIVNNEVELSGLKRKVAEQSIEIARLAGYRNLGV